MYCYSPPKSSVWGHKLGKMLPDRQKDLFAEFLRRAAAKYEARPGSLTISVWRPEFQKEGAEMLKRYEQALGAKAMSGHFFPRLDRSQFDKALQMLVTDLDLIKGCKGNIILMEKFTVTEWLIDGEPRSTDSEFDLQYGTLPCVSTFLHFASLAEFHCIQRVLSDLKFCKLNEKHLKAAKPRGGRK